jgi:hypothetical protein
MDEEDGRLGPRVKQTGRFDVLTDASAKSLPNPAFDLSNQVQHGANVSSTRAKQHPNEVNHENVPGK